MWSLDLLSIIAILQTLNAFSQMWRSHSETVTLGKFTYHEDLNEGQIPQALGND